MRDDLLQAVTEPMFGRPLAEVAGVVQVVARNIQCPNTAVFRQLYRFPDFAYGMGTKQPIAAKIQILCLLSFLSLTSKSWPRRP